MPASLWKEMQGRGDLRGPQIKRDLYGARRRACMPVNKFMRKAPKMEIFGDS